MTHRYKAESRALSSGPIEARPIRAERLAVEARRFRFIVKIGQARRRPDSILQDEYADGLTVQLFALAIGGTL